MIKFSLKNSLVNNTDSSENNDTNDIFNFDLSLMIIPSPKKIVYSGNTGINYPFKLNLDIEGTFISANDIPMRQKDLHIMEPNWTVAEFASRISGWLEEAWIHEKTPKLAIAINTSNTQVNTAIENLEEFVPSDCRSQAYYLRTTPEELCIYSWTKHGSYYGFLTLSQLARIREGKIYFPICEVWDYPDYEIRGLEDDISRGQRPTIEHFKEFITYLSRLKINLEGLYIEDMFKFDKYPTIGQGRAPLTKSEIKELEKFALERFIEIIPAVEMFGHMDNMLTLPEFRKYGEFPGAQCLDISSEDAHRLADELLKELCETFSSKTFALVCDESFDCGLGSSREYINSKGKAVVLAEWYIYLMDVVKKYGKPFPAFAHDILIHYPKTMKLVQGKIPLVLFWSYSNRKHYPTISKIKRKGFDVAAVPTTFDWSRHYPYSDYAEMNTIYMGKDALERGANALITSKFGDLFNENLRENIRYGLAVAAQAGWNVNNTIVWNEKGKLDCTPLKKAFINWYFGTDDLRIIRCMNILSKQNDVLPRFPNGMLNHFWMDPYSRDIKQKELEFSKRFVKEANFLIKCLSNIRKDNTLKKNVFQLDFLMIASRMALHFGIKNLAAEAAWSEKYGELNQILTQILELSNLNLIPKTHFSDQKISQFTQLAAVFNWLSADIQDMKIEYERLWKIQAVPEGLEYPLHRFDVLNWYYERSIQKLEKNEKPEDSQLKSEWIWCNGRRLSAEWGNRKLFYFYDTFAPKKVIKRVRLQGIANNYMKVYINGKFVGEVLSRFSQSSLPMAKSVQVFDVTNLINQKTKNIISVEGINYPNGIGGINIILHMEYEDGTTEDFITDGSWRYTDISPNPWPLTADFFERDIESWRNVRSLGRPPLAGMAPISLPNWDKNWKSEISFSFGMRNFVETQIVSVTGNKLYKKVFWAIPAGMRIMGTDVFGFRKL
jgi:hypothetical protein